MLVLFKNLSLTKSLVGYLALFFLFSVIDNFEWFWMESILNYYCYYIIIIAIVIIIVIVIKNFSLVGIKVLQIVFRPKQLIKANCKPSRMKNLKNTFQQSFEFHNCW